MANLHVATKALGFAASLALAACSGLPEATEQQPSGIILGWYPPWTLNQSPERIALRWYPDVTPSGAANQTAQLHCASWDKSAELVSDTLDGSVEIAEYHCR